MGLGSSGVEADTFALGPSFFVLSLLLIITIINYYSDTWLLIVLGSAKLSELILLSFPSDGITSKTPSCPTFLNVDSEGEPRPASLQGK